MKTHRIQLKRNIKSNFEPGIAEIEFLEQLQYVSASSGVMGQPELTVTDNHLAALSELHGELHDSDQIAEERLKRTVRQKVIAMVRELKQDRGTVVKITIETVREDQTLSRIIFHVQPRRIVEWKKRLLGKIAVILNEKELKKLRVKAGKLTVESRLLGLTLDEAIISSER